HRDIKPSNILVRADGEPKLLDFGIAKPLAAETAAEQTGTQLHPMTREYAAPEQVLGEPITVATDVYALGVLLYRLLAGRMPYRRAELGEVSWAKAIIEEAPEPLDRAIDRTDDANAIAASRGTSAVAMKRVLRGDLERLVQRALAKSPEARYPTVGALADDLAAWLGHRALSGGTRTYRLRKFVARHWLPLAVGAVALLAIVAGAAGVAWEARQRELAAENALREAKTSASVKDFVIGLFDAVDPKEAKGRVITARELLERGKKDIDSRPPQDPIVRAEMQAVLGRIDYHLGLYSEASELQRAAAETFKSTGTRQLQLVQAYLDRAETAIESIEVKVASASIDAAAAELAAMPDAPARERARLSTLRSALDVQRHKFEDAKRNADAAIALARAAHLDDRLLSRALMLEGDAEWGLHVLDSAEQHFREALTLAEEADGPDALSVASLHRDLGIIHAARSRYAEALAEVQASLAIHEKVLGAEHALTLDDNEDIGKYKGHLGHFREASGILQNVDAIRARTLGAASPERGGTLINLGVALLDNDDLAGAEHAFEGAISVWQPKMGREFPGVQVALGNLAHAHYLDGRLDEAEAELGEVRTNFGKLGMANDPELSYQLGELQRRRGNAKAAVELDRNALAFSEKENGEKNETTAIAHHFLALALRDADNAAEAEREFRAALVYYADTFAVSGHPYAAAVELDLARLLAGEAGRRDEAHELAADAGRVRSQFFGPDDRRTRDAETLAERIDASVPADASASHRAKHPHRST
ncbi:MAG TPA: serine/threonine-protein kinase, partial [Rhodanobacteraceae bacterium]|nr:serine/threonine-protein kinase [Rhodanobacteraceae bacterium]